MYCFVLIVSGKFYVIRLHTKRDNTKIRLKHFPKKDQAIWPVFFTPAFRGFRAFFAPTGSLKNNATGKELGVLYGVLEIAGNFL